MYVKFIYQVHCSLCIYIFNLLLDRLIKVVSHNNLYRDLNGMNWSLKQHHKIELIYFGCYVQNMWVNLQFIFHFIHSWVNAGNLTGGLQTGDIPSLNTERNSNTMEQRFSYLYVCVCGWEGATGYMFICNFGRNTIRDALQCWNENYIRFSGGKYFIMNKSLFYLMKQIWKSSHEQ